MNYDIKSLAGISLTLDMNFRCDLGESIQKNDTFMRGSCLSYEVRNVFFCYQTKHLPSDMLYVHENVVCCFSILVSLNSICQSEVLQMLSVCAVLTHDVPECLAILPATALNVEFHVDITIHMAIYRYTEVFSKLSKLKLPVPFRQERVSSFLVAHTLKTTIIYLTNQ